jgi:hypothetical protein
MRLHENTKAIVSRMCHVSVTTFNKYTRNKIHVEHVNLFQRYSEWYALEKIRWECKKPSKFTLWLAHSHVCSSSALYSGGPTLTLVEKSSVFQATTEPQSVRKTSRRQVECWRSFFAGIKIF